MMQKHLFLEEKLTYPFLSSELRIGANPILSDTDRIVGRLLHLSTIEGESLPKAWYTLAGWCYKWGRKAVDNAR